MVKLRRTTLGVLVSQSTCLKSLQNLNADNHWLVKVEGEYRFVDCYLASQYQPINDGSSETHWFLSHPREMIYTHLPASKAYQFLDPPIDPEVYFALPYVCVPYFQYNLNVVNFDSSSLELVDDSGKYQATNTREENTHID